MPRIGVRRQACRLSQCDQQRERLLSTWSVSETNTQKPAMAQRHRGLGESFPVHTSDRFRLNATALVFPRRTGIACSMRPDGVEPEGATDSKRTGRETAFKGTNLPGGHHHSGIACRNPEAGAKSTRRGLSAGKLSQRMEASQGEPLSHQNTKRQRRKLLVSDESPQPARTPTATKGSTCQGRKPHDAGEYEPVQNPCQSYSGEEFSTFFTTAVLAAESTDSLTRMHPQDLCTLAKPVRVRITSRNCEAMLPHSSA